MRTIDLFAWTHAFSSLEFITGGGGREFINKPDRCFHSVSSAGNLSFIEQSHRMKSRKEGKKGRKDVYLKKKKKVVTFSA